jgi:hypothetical protein
MLGLLAAPAHADEVADFCADPYLAICGAQDAIGKQHDERLGAVIAGLRDNTEQGIAAKYGYQPADDSGYNAFAAAHPQLADAMKADFIATMRAGAMAWVGPDPYAWESRIESRLMEALLEAVEAEPTLAPSDRARFRAALSHVEIVDAQSILQQGTSHPLWHNFVYQCRENGLRDNAFHPPGQSAVVLCPGLILGARTDMTRTAASQDMFGGVVWTMAHETGHTLDNGNFPELYAPEQSCIEERYIRGGILKGFESLAPQSAEYRQILADHMEEIAADTWANETMARMIESMHDPVAGVRLLKGATVGLCGLRDDGKRYGNDAFRLGELLGHNPRVRAALGCAPVRAACGFAGGR